MITCYECDEDILPDQEIEMLNGRAVHRRCLSEVESNE